MYYVLVFKYNMWEVTAVCEYEQDAELIKSHKVLTNPCLVVYEVVPPDMNKDSGIVLFTHEGKVITAVSNIFSHWQYFST